MEKRTSFVLGTLAAISLCWSANQLYYYYYAERQSSKNSKVLFGEWYEFHLATEKLERNFTFENASNAQLKSQYALSEFLTSTPCKGGTFDNWPQLKHYIHDVQQCKVILVNHNCDSVIDDYLGKISLSTDLANDLRLNNGKISQTNWDRLLFMYGGPSLKRSYGKNSTNFCERE